MKKVLVVITTAFVPYGGLTSVMMNYWRAMDKRNLYFDFASSNNPPNSLLDEISSEECKYYQLPQRKFILPYIFALIRICKNYDVVHVHGNSSTSVLELVAGKIAGVPKRIVHNHNSVTTHPFLNRILHPLFIKIYTDAIACSSIAGEWLFGKGKFKILRNAIDVDKFSDCMDYREKSRKEFCIKDNEIVVGHVGKFNKQKNYPAIISVFAEYHKLQPKSKLLLIGDGDLFQKVKSECQRINISDSVIFAGRRIDIPYLMSAMDLFLFPSLWEGLPLSALEAQASGLPVFLSDTISKEVWISDNVHVCKLSDSSAIWAKEMFKSSKCRITQVAKNVKLLTNSGYNIKTEAKKLQDIYFE